MIDFKKIPEALDYIAGQSWLAPDEPVAAGLGAQAILPFGKARQDSVGARLCAR